MTDSASGATRSYIALVPRSATDSPSYWWSALRYMQAYRTFAQADLLATRLQEKVAAVSWPWVRGTLSSLEADMHWEVPVADIVAVEDKREASFIASEALHYLRSALDHLVYHVCWADAGSPQPRTQFPIFDDRCKYHGKNGASKQLQGMSPAHASLIAAVQPFEGVTWTSDLQVLSNADKHRVPIEVSPTVQLGVNFYDAIDDPQSGNGGKLAQIEEVALRFFLPALDPYGEFQPVFEAIFVGAAQLINVFLDEAGMSLLEVTARDSS